MKIAFHDNALSIRGTTVAIYDYAYYCKKMYGIECAIMYNSSLKVNSHLAIQKFKNEFEVFSYSKPSEMKSVLEHIRPDYFLMIKGGKWDDVMSHNCKNLVLAVSSDAHPGDKHGDVWAYCSYWLSQYCSNMEVPVVPHMINLPETNENLRKILRIPEDVTVFGRSGGYESFELPWVKDCIREILGIRKDVYFLFQNTQKFVDHPRVIHLGENADMLDKVRFINSCDAMIHSRHIGESFGLSCGEFSARNKPVITWTGSKERNHIFVLGDKGIYFDDVPKLREIFLTFDREYYSKRDNNAYREYYPDKVMPKFKEVFLK